MRFECKKTDNCFAASETWEYRLPETAETFAARLGDWQVKENRNYRRPMLLDGIEKYGSINQATHAMGMAYSKAWRIIKATEAEFGVLLVDRDGAHGSSITPQARELMETYRRLLSEAQDAADAVLAEK